MNKAERRQESERLRDMLTHTRDHLDVLVEHLEEDVLPPRMVAASAMMFPFLWTGYTGMQVVQSLHAAIALLMVGLIIGHIYIGTVGMEGAFSAMWSGWVDRNWAKEHHSLWYSGEDGEKRPAVVPIAGAPQSPPMTGAIGSFAIGIVVAIAIAVAMTGVFEAATLGSAAREALSNPAVHLDNVMPGRSASRSGSQP